MRKIKAKYLLFIVGSFLILIGDLFSQNPLDKLEYNYYANTNQLKHIDESVPLTSITDDLENQSVGNNYTYDANGRLTADASEGILKIEWTVAGKVKSVEIDDSVPLDGIADRIIQFTYDAMGNRVKKLVTDITTLNPQLTTYYVRNVMGEVISIYSDESGTIKRNEITINDGSDNVENFASLSETEFERIIGFKNYELKDHLDNIRVTISDIKEPNSGLKTFNSLLTTSTDYFSFGMLMDGRNYNSSDYRYGFNGKEKDDDLKNIMGSSYNFGARMYDSRLGLWLSIDPKEQKFPGISPYNFCVNNPILYNDPTGKEPGVGNLWETRTNFDPCAGIQAQTLDDYEMDKMVEASMAFGRNFESFREGLNTSSYSYKNEDRDPMKYMNCNGDCFMISKSRVAYVYEETFGISMIDAVKAQGNISPYLFNDLYNVAGKRTVIPDGIRSGGSASAMYFAGLGDIHDRESIMAGNLYPGALMQVYQDPDGEEGIRRNHETNPSSWGHSFIFNEYVYDGDNNIIGMKVTDQGFFNEENVKANGGQSAIFFDYMPVMWGSNIGYGNWQTKIRANGMIAEKYMRANESRLTDIGKKQEGELPTFEDE